MISILTVNTRARFSFLCVVKARLALRDVVALSPTELMSLHFFRAKTRRGKYQSCHPASPPQDRL